jgi:uncharacterized membrane protein YqiK
LHIPVKTVKIQSPVELLSMEATMRSWRVILGILIVVVVVVGFIYLFIKSYLEETKREKMEKRGERWVEKDLRGRD